MNKIVQRIVQVIVTIGVLVWVFHDRQMCANIPMVIHKADIRWILIGIACAGVAELANIFRWQIFLRVQKVNVPLARTAMVFMIGVFFNLFLFGTMGGDVVRAAYLCADQKRKKAGVIISVIVDRLIGMLVLVPIGVAVVVLRYQWFRKTSTATALLWFLIIFLVVMTAFFAMAIVITRLGATSRLPRWLSKRESWMRVIEACGLFGKLWRESCLAYLLSVPVLFGTFLSFYCAARAFGAAVSLMDILSIMPIVTVVTSLPISFSGIGVREQLFKNLLADLTGIPTEVAVLISLAGFLSYISWSLVGAVIYLLARPAQTKPHPSKGHHFVPAAGSPGARG